TAELTPSVPPEQFGPGVQTGSLFTSGPGNLYAGNTPLTVEQVSPFPNAPIETSAGTTGYIYSSYGSLVSARPSAMTPPSRARMLDETVAAPQAAQLSPGGILDPGLNLPDYGTERFQTAFSDFGDRLTPTAQQIAAATPTPAETVTPVSGAATVDPFGGAASS